MCNYLRGTKVGKLCSVSLEGENVRVDLVDVRLQKM